MFMHSPKEERKQENVHLMEEWGKCSYYGRMCALLERELIRSLFVVYRLLHIQTKYKRKECPTDMFKNASTYKLACAQK